MDLIYIQAFFLQNTPIWQYKSWSTVTMKRHF